MNSKKSNKVRLYQTVPDRILTLMVWLLLLLIFLVIIVPILFIVASSFSDPGAVSAGKVFLWPVDFSLAGYRVIFQSSYIMRGFYNSVVYTLLGTVISVTLTLFAGYPLARKDLKIRGVVMFLFTVTMFFSGGMIPTYLVVKDFGLLDSFWVMVLPFSVITYYIIVARTFFNNSIPGDLWEAAQIDGCGNLNFFFRIVLPLSKAVIAVIALWTAVGQWNSYFNALIYLRSPELQPLQLVLRNILISNQTISAMATGAAAVEAKQMADLIKYAIIVVSSAPIMCMYPFVQKYFNQGVMLGSLKG